MNVLDHPRGQDIIAVATKRLAQHIHSLDPTTIASAEMSFAKADGKYFEALEDLLRRAVTCFDASTVIAQALQLIEESGP